jgi:hypothetical protein
MKEASLPAGRDAALYIQIKIYEIMQKYHLKLTFYIFVLHLKPITPPLGFICL